MRLIIDNLCVAFFRMNSRRMSVYSAICADCNELITDCSLQSVAVTATGQIAK